MLARIEWFSPITDVDIGETLGLLHTIERVKDLQLWNMDFEIDSKTILDTIYNTQQGVSESNEIINNCVHMLFTDLLNSYVKFVRRQTNKVAHSLAKAALLEASFCIHYNILSGFENILINEMH